jgi:hypothetical protein
MAMTPESKVKAKIKVYLKTVPDCWFFMPIGGDYSTHGVPDIVGHVIGWFFGIEVKAPGKELNTTPNQKAQLARIRGAKGMSMVASNVVDVKEMFRILGMTPY